MLEPLTELPDGVIGFTAVGELHSDDYEQVLIPAIEQQLAAGEKVRIVLVFPSFDGVSGGAMWDDLKMGSITSPTGSGSPWSPTSTG